MPTITLSRILHTMSVEDLHLLAEVKQKLDKLQGKRSAIREELAAVERKLQHLRKVFPQHALDRPSLARIRRSIQKARKEKRPRQPTIEALITEILKESKGPLSVNELSRGLLNEKGYKTTSPNVRNQLPVLLYRNQKGLFRKVGTGRFALSEAKAPAARKRKPIRKAVSPKKKRAAATTKKAVPKRTAPKPAPGKKGSRTDQVPVGLH